MLNVHGAPGPGLFADDPAAERLRLALLAAHHAVGRHAALLLQSHGITKTQAEILLVVRDFGPLSLREVGDLVVCESGSPSRPTDDLARRGYLSRRRRGSDRRALRVAITAAGLELLASITHALRPIQVKVGSSLLAAEMASAAEALAAVIAGTEEHAALLRRFERLEEKGR